MITYRMNAFMAGSLYFMGTVFGITSALVGGKVLSSVVSGKSLSGLDLLGLVSANSSQLNGGTGRCLVHYNLPGPVGSFVFLIGATFLYISFYRTQLIPRWLSIWGFIYR